jgi:hypothetical protein
MVSGYENPCKWVSEGERENFGAFGKEIVRSVETSNGMRSHPLHTSQSARDPFVNLEIRDDFCAFCGYVVPFVSARLFWLRFVSEVFIEPFVYRSQCPNDLRRG